MPAEYSVNAWTPAGAQESREFTTPSGQKCLVRDLGLEDVVDLGLLDKMDSLGAIVQEEHIDRAAGKSKKKPGKSAVKPADEKAEAMAMLRDPSKMAGITAMMDGIAMACVVQPKLHNPWIDSPDGRRKMDKNERDSTLAYVDYVNFADKMAIFNEVFGGMESLETFRQAAETGVAALEDESKSVKTASGTDVD